MKLKIRSFLGISIVISTIFFLVGFKPVDKIKIVMFGDSIIKMGNWNELLSRSEIKNSGFSGFTTSHLIWLIHDNVIVEKPEICFLEGGINDIGVGIPLNRIKSNYTSLVDTLLANKITPVLQSTLYQVNNPESKVLVDSLNHFLVALSKTRHIQFLDVNSKLSNSSGLRPEYSIDGTHINDAAYKIWAGEITTFLTRIEGQFNVMKTDQAPKNANNYEQFLVDQKVAKRADKSEAAQHNLDWWREARFGMFIHWGPSSLTGSEISLSKQFYDDSGEHKLYNPRPSASPDHPEHHEWYDWFGPPVPRVVYDNLYKSFYPGMFNADSIIAMAKNAGMKYIIPVTKHCDGFSMWNSKFTDYDVMSTPFKRDIIDELAKACEKAGMKFGIYYQQRDWHHPDFGTPRMVNYNEFMFNQINELLERYPGISILWFDAHEGYSWELWEGDKLYRMIHKLRPDIIINDRCGLKGDFFTPEQQIGTYDLDRDWESNMTFTGTFSWSTFYKPVIPFEQMLGYLVCTAGGNGNLLMNVGPMPTGQIDPRDVDRLKRVGEWMKVHGESIYGTKGGPFKPNDFIATTRKGNTVYLHILKWDGNTLRIPTLPNRNIVQSSVLGGGKVFVEKDGDQLRINVEIKDRSGDDTVVKLELDGSAMDITTLPSINPFERK